MKPGQVEGIDPEYKRHGTTGIIASRDVVTGEIVAPLIQPTRKEEDYLNHIETDIVNSGGHEKSVQFANILRIID